jgi:hypothetical protein
MMTASVSGSSLKSVRTSMKLVPMIGVAADAHAGGLPEAERRELTDGLVGERARPRAHHADAPGVWM